VSRFDPKTPSAELFNFMKICKTAILIATSEIQLLGAAIKKGIAHSNQIHSFAAEWA
jgi:hypothetical protein